MWVQNDVESQSTTAMDEDVDWECAGGSGPGRPPHVEAEAVLVVKGISLGTGTWRATGRTPKKITHACGNMARQHTPATAHRYSVEST